jgi:hypothetical protein
LYTPPAPVGFGGNFVFLDRSAQSRGDTLDAQAFPWIGDRHNGRAVELSAGSRIAYGR